jgi:phenylacetate-CoA ligase
MRQTFLRLLFDARSVRKKGPGALARCQRTRLAEMVGYARAYSPYYRELYQNLPEHIEDAALLPVTDKKKLMARFNDWVTDREVTIDKVRSFIRNPTLIGAPFLGKYLVSTTSGITGYQGIFVLDERHLAVASAFMGFIFNQWLTGGDFAKVLGRGMRIALLHATGGHYVSVASTARSRRFNRLLGRQLREFSVHAPLPALRAKLNELRPAMILGYAATISLLAREQEARRLHINPVLIVLTAEGLAQREYDRIRRVFGSKVAYMYGSTEITQAAYSCAEGWLHVLSDWTVVEPVDVDYRPTQPGEQSHTVLVSNLVNRVQPILRYDLGDSILQRPDPCPCGNPSPAVRVQGRAADVLHFTGERGERVAIPPLALEFDDIPGVELSQIVQRTPTNLRMRLKLTAGVNPDKAWQSVHTQISRLLADNKLNSVMIERAGEPPEQSAGGKYRSVIPLS